jgi:hypothetical protein
MERPKAFEAANALSKTQLHQYGNVCYLKPVKSYGYDEMHNGIG